MTQYLYGILTVNYYFGMIDISFRNGNNLGGLDIGVPFEILDKNGIWHKTRLVNRFGNIILMNIGVPVEAVIGCNVRIAVN